MSKESIGKSYHTDNGKFNVTVYNSNGVMTSIDFENEGDAVGYYEHALYLGYHATLTEKN